MAQLQDITIYYEGNGIAAAPDGRFKKILNFVADFYHQALHGYKPLKTGRICIHLSENNIYKEPFYFGSICRFGQTIDEEKYNSLKFHDQERYILDLLHSSILELAEQLNWDKNVFIKAYKQILDSNFRFIKQYPSKLASDKKIRGQAIIEKTLDKSFLNVVISEGESQKQIKLIEKKNSYWYDSIYKLAKSAKWLDDDSFGIVEKEKDGKAYFSIKEGKVISTIEFVE